MSAAAKLVVLFSGSGRTLENLATCCLRQTIPAHIVLAVASRDGIQGIAVARRHGIPCKILDPSHFGTTRAHADAVWDAILLETPDLILLAGYLHLLPLHPDYRGKVMNIHPALLPDFGGRGFFGHHVHEAVLESGVTKSGCTVHFATDAYDAGPIILQREVPVMPEDTVETLAARVFQQECIAYPEAINMFLAGRLDGR